MGCQIHELAIDWIPKINYSIEGTCPKRRLINNYFALDAVAYRQALDVTFSQSAISPTLAHFDNLPTHPDDDICCGYKVIRFVRVLKFWLNGRFILPNTNGLLSYHGHLLCFNIISGVT